MISYVEKLSYLKRTRRLTNEALAELARIPLGTVNKICAGQTKQPSFHSLFQIFRALRAPLCYMLDPEVPSECDLCAYTDAAGCLSLSEEEMALIQLSRQLSPQSRASAARLVGTLAAPPRPLPNGADTRRLICYLHPRQSPGVQGPFRVLELSLDPVSARADFAVRLQDAELEPLYAPGDILLMRRTQARPGQLGLFLVNQKPLLREYVYRRGIHKLVSPTLGARDLILTEEDRLLCLGIPLGVATGCRWV